MTGGCEDHIRLHVEGSDDGTQPVPARRLPDGTFEILYSPGFVEGVAAGDIIRVTNAKTGTFEVVRRGGNLAVKVFREPEIRSVLAWLEPRFAELSARIDGHIERAFVLTIPVRTGFTAVEAAMSAASAEFSGLEWYYGNVYDEEGRPLNWWTHDT